MAHTTKSGGASAVATDLARSGKTKDIVTVCSLYGDMGMSGPALVAADTAWPQIEYEAEWNTVAQLAGQDLPWWPSLLRVPELIRQWRPGSKPVTVEIPADDREPVLRRAARNRTFAPVSQEVLLDMANDIRNQRVDSVAKESDIFRSGRPGWPSRIVIPAQHDPATHHIPVEANREVLSVGWHALTTSTEPDAVAAVGIARSRDPRLLPYGSFTEVPVKPGAVADRWARRLVPCDPNAGHAQLAEDRPIDAFFTDPLTDMPVLRTQGDTPRWIFYAPTRLPAGQGELASVVLWGTVWITTSDDQVHPAPCDPREHLWFGPGGGDRPSEAATVIDRLLDDLGAEIDMSKHWNAPKGLTALLNENHRHGTELSRAALLHARMTPPKP
jgi:hypothetical protein